MSMINFNTINLSCGFRLSGHTSASEAYGRVQSIGTFLIKKLVRLLKK
jgi:hypothetical protein